MKELIEDLTALNCFYNKKVRIIKGEEMCLSMDCMVRHAGMEKEPFDCHMYKNLKYIGGKHVFVKEVEDE